MGSRLNARMIDAGVIKANDPGPSITFTAAAPGASKLEQLILDVKETKVAYEAALAKWNALTDSKERAGVEVSLSAKRSASAQQALIAYARGETS